jgi:glycosyltransferase involved in cell wall biosynthesis
VVLWVQDLWPESLSATGYVRNRVVLKFVQRLVRSIYRHCDLLLVQSRAFEIPVRALAGTTPVVYYPNSEGNHLLGLAQKETPQVEGLNHGFSVLFAGNIGSAQAVEVILEVASLLRDHSDIHFVVLGDGSRRDWMCKEARKRELVNLHLPGRFPVEDMPSLMAKASALLVTLADRPIFSLTVPSKMQAYLAAGRPILACLNGEGANLITESGAGVAVSAEDAPALADAVVRLYRMPVAEREAMGDRGRAYHSKHFSHGILIEQLIGHLQSVGLRKKEAS